MTDASHQPSKTGTQTLNDLCQSLAARQPTPGGGAAAAAAAAIGAAAGAMAARYTTGKKWADTHADAEELASYLDHVITTCIKLADQDQAAYSDLQRTWREDMPADQITAIQHQARSIPAELIATCAEACSQIQNFLPRCNPLIVSDAQVAIHLLAAAAAAAWHTLLINEPDENQTAQAQALLADCRMAAEVALGYGR